MSTAGPRRGGRALGYHLEQATRYRADLGATRRRGGAGGERAAHGSRPPSGTPAGLPAAVRLLERAATLAPRGDIDLALETELSEALFWIGQERRRPSASGGSRSAIGRRRAIRASELCGRIRSDCASAEFPAGARERFIALIEASPAGVRGRRPTCLCTSRTPHCPTPCKPPTSSRCLRLRSMPGGPATRVHPYWAGSPQIGSSGRLRRRRCWAGSRQRAAARTQLLLPRVQGRRSHCAGRFHAGVRRRRTHAQRPLGTRRRPAGERHGVPVGAGRAVGGRSGGRRRLRRGRLEPVRGARRRGFLSAAAGLRGQARSTRSTDSKRPAPAGRARQGARHRRPMVRGDLARGAAQPLARRGACDEASGSRATRSPSAVTSTTSRAGRRVRRPGGGALTVRRRQSSPQTLKQARERYERKGNVVGAARRRPARRARRPGWPLIAGSNRRAPPTTQCPACRAAARTA